MGHDVEEPVQVSATSQAPALARQVVVEGSMASVGHAAEEPVQVSALSHDPLAARQEVVLALKASVGHAAEEPVHVSAVSHVPAEARQDVVLALKASVGQVVLALLQVSAVSQVPADARQVMVLVVIGPHVPVTAAPVAALHAMQSVVSPAPQAALQQTPSAQKPLVHWVAAVHAVPLGDKALLDLKTLPMTGKWPPCQLALPKGVEQVNVPPSCRSRRRGWCCYCRRHHRIHRR